MTQTMPTMSKSFSSVVDEANMTQSLKNHVPQRQPNGTTELSTQNQSSNAPDQQSSTTANSTTTHVNQQSPNENNPPGLHSVFAFQSRFSSIFTEKQAGATQQGGSVETGSGSESQQSNPSDATSTSQESPAPLLSNQSSSTQQDQSSLNFSPGSSIQRAPSSSSSTSSTDAQEPSTPRESFFDNFHHQNGGNTQQNGQPSGNASNGANGSFVSSPSRNLSSIHPTTPLSPNHFSTSGTSLGSPSRDLSAFSTSGDTRSPLNHSGMWNEQYSSPHHTRIGSLGGDHPPQSPSTMRQLADQFDNMSFGPPPTSIYDIYTPLQPRHHTSIPIPQTGSLHYYSGHPHHLPPHHHHAHPHQPPHHLMHTRPHPSSHSAYSTEMPHYQDRLVTPPSRSYSPYSDAMGLGGTSAGMMGSSMGHLHNHHPHHHHHMPSHPHHPHHSSQNHIPQSTFDSHHSHKSPSKRNQHGLQSSNSSSSSSSSSSKAMNFTSMKEVEGRIYELAKDQYGCRFLQKKLEEGNAEEVEIIFNEIFPKISELMIDPFGNYLCQKLVEHCNDVHKTKIIRAVSNDLVKISTNMHGTRAVQKLIECIGTSKQIKLVTRSLKSHVVSLIKDLNGNHVIQRCLQKLSAKDKQFIYDAVAGRCVEVATHKHGCCVLQRCVDYASPEQKDLLNKEIIHHALSLVQNPFGNYVVQYILDLGDAEVNNLVIRKFLGSIYVLSTNKFSSNVIEKCLRISNTLTRQEMVDELANLPSLCTVLQDSYGNYVIQTALTVADPVQFEELARVLKPQLHLIKNTPFGKKIENRLNKQRTSRMARAMRAGMHHHQQGAPAPYPSRMAPPPGYAHHATGHPPMAPHHHQQAHHQPHHPHHTATRDQYSHLRDMGMGRRL